MTNGDREGQSFVSHPHTKHLFFFLLTTKYLILYSKNMKKLPESPDNAEMRHVDVILILQWRHELTSGQGVADMFVFISFPRASKSMFDIE